MQVERLTVRLALSGLGALDAPVGPGLLALARGLSLLDLSGGLAHGSLFGPFPPILRGLLSAACLEFRLEPLALLCRLGLVLGQLGLGIGLLGLAPGVRRLDARLALGLLEAALAGKVVVAGHFAGQLLGFAGDLADQPAAGSFLGFGFGHLRGPFVCLGAPTRDAGSLSRRGARASSSPLVPARARPNSGVGPTRDSDQRRPGTGTSKPNLSGSTLRTSGTPRRRATRQAQA